MEPTRLTEIYQQLFSDKNQPDTVLEKKRMILRHSAALFIPNMSDVERVDIIKAALKLNAAEVNLRAAAISQNAGVLFTPNIRAYDCTGIIEVILN